MLRLCLYPGDVAGTAEVQVAVKTATVSKLQAAWARIDSHLSARRPYLLGAELRIFS